ncbi:MAG: methionine--tRNA ligase, partial [Sphingomonas sp.]
QDGSYSAEAIVTKVNADLANSFGNLAQRTLSFIAKNCDGILPQLEDPEPGTMPSNDRAFLLSVKTAARIDLPEKFERLELSQGIEIWLQAVFRCNQYIDLEAPWTLKKTDPDRMRVVLATLVQAIIDLAVAISPVIPSSAGKLLDMLGVPENERNYAALKDDGRYARLAASGFRLAAPAPIFPRLDMPEEG